MSGVTQLEAESGTSYLRNGRKLVVTAEHHGWGHDNRKIVGTRVGKASKGC